MATIVYFEGADEAINLDHIVSFKMVTEDEDQPAWAIFEIVFMPIQGDSGSWQFKTKEYRDEVFMGIVNAKSSKVFPSEGSSSGELPIA